MIGRDRRNEWSLNRRLGNPGGRARDEIAILTYIFQNEAVGRQRLARALERVCGMQGSSNPHCRRNQIGAVQNVNTTTA